MPGDLIYGTYQPRIVLMLPPYNIPDEHQGRTPTSFPLRWDNAPEIQTKNGGAIFANAPTLHYSAAAGAPEKGVAEHIKKAFTDPAATIPKISGKVIPGSNLAHPLHRLYSDTKRRDRNGAVAIAACKKYYGDDYAKASIPGKDAECDEFPFRTTMEGAAQYELDPARASGPGNYSALPVIDGENRAGGILLSGFYTKNRVIEGYDDPFTVDIDQSMSDYQTQFVNWGSEKCLEIDGSSGKNGARAQQWECKDQAGADWVLKPEGNYFRIINANSGKCLEVADSRQDNGAPVQQWDCVPQAKTQLWDRMDLIDPTWGDFNGTVFFNSNSHKALEIDGSSKENGALAQQWDYAGQHGARWKVGVSK
ncbi:RICIN domain-containing protein [Streptomyces nondiastaticus]|uniref:RICIN domain-containing protein n=1 Tax=Streptomyces nondiastaticus TaxID=3154512 RepID=A0ABW6U6X1_9ACTN